MSEQFCTVDQAAKRLRLHRKTVLRLIHEGRLRGTRIGKSYRIVQSDLEAFGGVQKGSKSLAMRARVSCAIDVSEVSTAISERLATMLNAAVTSDAARPDPLHLSTIYDPEKHHLKVVMIGSPLDLAALLKTLHVFVEAAR
jgi:excisionase family DNA binding protein